MAAARTPDADPFAHHPELRDKITDPDRSFFRDLRIEDIFTRYPEQEANRDWFHSDDTREALRHEALADHRGDLWVFAYGSLMWDPALHFTDLRRARLPGFARRMILVDTRGGRGSAEAPGLMAALDDGEACDGLVFRIAADAVDIESEILFRREAIAPGYLARFVTVEVGPDRIRALTFIADHDVPDIRNDLCPETQIRYIAHGAGILGTSRDYLASIVDHFDALGIEDPHCADLLRDVDAHRAVCTHCPPPQRT